MAHSCTNCLKYVQETRIFCALYVAFAWLLCFQTAVKHVTCSFFIQGGESDENVKHLKIPWCHFKCVWSYKLSLTQRILAKETNFHLNNHRHDEIGSLTLSESERCIFQNDTTLTQDFSHACQLNVWFITIRDPGYNIGNLMARLLQIDFAYSFMRYINVWRIVYHKV